MFDSSDDEFHHLKQCERDYDKVKEIQVLTCNCDDIKDIADERCPVHGGRKRVSPVWKFCIRMGNQLAKCKLCGKFLSYRTSITNLRKHLLRSHRSRVISSLRRKTNSKQSSNTGLESPLATYVREVNFSLNENDKSREVSPEKKSPIKEDGVLVDDYHSRKREKAERVQNEGYIKNENEAGHEVMIEETYLDEDILQDDPPSFKGLKKCTQNMVEREDSIEWEASIDRFGAYVASLMKLLPRMKAARYQVQIINKLVTESCVKE